MGEMGRQKEEKLNACLAYGVCPAGEKNIFPCGPCPNKNRG